MTDIEKESIEQLKSWREYIIKHKESVNKANDIEFYLRTALNLIQKQDTEINKLNNVIDKLVGEVEVLNYEIIGEWCNKDKGDKCKNCDTNNHDCIKEYFMKEDCIEK